MKILVTGSCGQIGGELVPFLREIYGFENVIATDIDVSCLVEKFVKPVEKVDVRVREEIRSVIKRYNVDIIIHLAAILSAKGERDPELAWRVNAEGTYNILEEARTNDLAMIFIPSSIAVYGPETPDFPDEMSVTKPKTMYGITKVLAELLGEYYYARYKLDVRGLRLPGVISWKIKPGGGTTDYAIEAFYEAVKTGEYVFWVRPDTTLPMIYMPDVLRAFKMLLEADRRRLTISFYNVQGMSFSAEELYRSIKKYIPEFKAVFKPDPLRQRIADSWPKRINDSRARADWGWYPEWDLDSMSRDMIENIRRHVRDALTLAKTGEA
ncbi:MAG: NAD-dependent epimerase/dehydratase family protein [Sulfolobales archaeon]